MPEPRVLSVEVAKLAQERGKKSYEQRAYTEKLTALMPSAMAQGKLAQLDIYSLLILSKFDFTTSNMEAMRREHWNTSIDQIEKMLELLVLAHKGLTEQSSCSTVRERFGADDWCSYFKHQELLLSFIEKIDDELRKINLFNANSCTDGCDVALNSIFRLLRLFNKALGFFMETQQPEPLFVLSFRWLEQLDELSGANDAHMQDSICKFACEHAEYILSQSQVRNQTWRQIACVVRSHNVRCSPGYPKEAAVPSDYVLGGEITETEASERLCSYLSVHSPSCVLHISELMRTFKLPFKCVHSELVRALFKEIESSQRGSDFIRRHVNLSRFEELARNTSESWQRVTRKDEVLDQIQIAARAQEVLVEGTWNPVYRGRRRKQMRLSGRLHYCGG